MLCKFGKIKSQSDGNHRLAILVGDPGGARTHDPMIKSHNWSHILFLSNQRVALRIVVFFKTFYKTLPVLLVNNSDLYTSLHHIIIERTVTSFVICNPVIHEA